MPKKENQTSIIWSWASYHHFCNLLFITQDQSYWKWSRRPCKSVTTRSQYIGSILESGYHSISMSDSGLMASPVWNSGVHCVVTCEWRLFHDYCIQMTSRQCQSSELYQNWLTGEGLFKFNTSTGPSPVSTIVYRGKWSLGECLPTFNACI